MRSNRVSAEFDRARDRTGSAQPSSIEQEIGQGRHFITLDKLHMTMQGVLFKNSARTCVLLGLGFLSVTGLVVKMALWSLGGWAFKGR